MKTKLVRPTAAEDAAIAAAIAEDSDTYELTAAEFAGLRHAVGIGVEQARARQFSKRSIAEIAAEIKSGDRQS